MCSIFLHIYAVGLEITCIVLCIVQHSV